MAYWDFLQMTPENQAAARKTSWGSALGQDFNPRNPNYQGFRPNPANVAQGSRVGLGSYINQGLNSLRGVFKPGSNVGGATTLMRKMAMSPVARGIGTVGRVAGLANPMGAAAMSAWAAPKAIDYLTKRDPNATETRFGLNIKDLEDKAAAYDAENIPLQDWASPMGVVPGDDIQEQVTETETLDPYTGLSMRDISGEVGEYGDKPGEGFNEEMFYQEPGMWDKFKGMFQRPEAKQKEFEAYEASMNPQGWGDFGDYKGNIWEGSGGNKINVVDPVTGATVLQNKNFDSAFGSGSVQEMIDKKDAWIADRLLSGKKISKALTSYAMNKGLGTFGGDKPGIGPDRPRGDPTYRGPKTYDFNPNITSKPTHIGSGPLHGATTTTGYQGKQGSHHYMRGGRVGYNTGGRVGILAAF